MRRRPAPDPVVFAGTVGNSTRPSNGFIPAGPAGTAPPVDPTTASDDRLHLVPPGTGFATGDQALSDRARGTIAAAHTWLQDLDLRAAMAAELAADDTDPATIVEAIGAGVDLELSDAAADIRYAAHGMAQTPMSDAAGRLEALRPVMARVVALDARSAAQWSSAGVAAALLVARGELHSATVAVATAADRLGLDGIPMPTDPADAWWHRTGNLSVELGQAARRVEAAIVTNRRRPDGQSEAGHILLETANRLDDLADLAEQLAQQSRPDDDPPQPRPLRRDRSVSSVAERRITTGPDFIAGHQVPR
jgi:hypothetical protein